MKRPKVFYRPGKGYTRHEDTEAAVQVVNLPEPTGTIEIPVSPMEPTEVFQARLTIEEWMERSHRRTQHRALKQQVERARRKGSTRTLVPLNELERLIAEAER